METQKNLTEDDIDTAFRTGSVFDVSDNALMEYLKVLNTSAIHNDLVRHRATNRCLTITTIINQRLVKKIDQGNTRLAYLVIVLSVVSLIASALQIIIAIEFR